MPALSLLRSLSSADKDTTVSLPDLFAGRQFRQEPIATPRLGHDGPNSQSAANIVQRLRQQGNKKVLRGRKHGSRSMGDDAAELVRGSDGSLQLSDVSSLPRVSSLGRQVQPGLAPGRSVSAWRLAATAAGARDSPPPAMLASAKRSSSKKRLHTDSVGSMEGTGSVRNLRDAAASGSWKASSPATQATYYR